MRTITTTLGELEAIANKFGTTISELVNLHGSPLPPKKHDAHYYDQMIGEWNDGCNAHIESYHDHLDASGYDGTELPSQYLDQW